jgi:hypothetical protein
MCYTTIDGSVDGSEAGLITVNDTRVIDNNGKQKRPSACAALLRRHCHY